MKKLLMTLVVGLLTASPSYAAVFNVTGVTDLTGNITIDTVLGTVTAADLNYSVNSPPDYTNVFDQGLNDTTSYFINVANGTTPTGPTSSVDIVSIIFGPSGSLVGFEGGTIIFAQFASNCTVTTVEFLCSNSSNLTLKNAALTPTPLPAALPLFATGLGALGLLGWRSKRKAQAVA